MARLKQTTDGGETLRPPNRYAQIIERIFRSRYRPGDREVTFEREELLQAARDLGVNLPKNIGDLVYSFRYRTPLPASVLSTAGPGETWLIRAAGRARYRLVLVPEQQLAPSPMLAETKIPDATPGVIAMYALGDEQALLAKLRYNRLLDIFTGVACYSLQNHLRTTVTGIGQVETDELYIGIDRRGAHFVFPIQAKGGRDKLNIVQIEQDVGLCATKFPSLICRPIAAQFMRDDVIALFEFDVSEQGVTVVLEKHYRLVSPDAMTAEDLGRYARRPEQT